MSIGKILQPFGYCALSVLSGVWGKEKGLLRLEGEVG